MTTFFQLKKFREKKKAQCLVKALKKCPQRKGICTKILVKTPKKPCSAKRKVMRVRLTSRRFVFAYIPGEGEQTLRAFSRVLIRGGSRPDLPGVHYIIIRGKFDLNFLPFRRQGRSKFGMKGFFQARKKDRKNAFASYFEKKKNQSLQYQKKHQQFLKKNNFFFLKKKLFLSKIYLEFNPYRLYIFQHKVNKSSLFFFFRNYKHNKFFAILKKKLLNKLKKKNKKI